MRKDHLNALMERIIERHIKGVLFDFDGTLADTLPSITDGVNLTLEHYGYPPKTEQEVRLAIGNGARILAERIIPKEKAADSAYVDGVLAYYCSSYEKTFLNCRECYPGIKELLIGLKKRGIKLGVVSNKPDPMTKALCKCLFEDGLLDFVLGQTSLPLKPYPDALLLGARTFGLPPEQCAMVGDGETDMKAAANAGMLAIGVSWGYRSRDILEAVDGSYVVDTVDELAVAFGIKDLTEAQ
ncbi:MAG: HAD family hydrolase [Clostridia bacterium]|nr:HAD family hydrolase [Clostridia bacterium]